MQVWLRWYKLLSEDQTKSLHRLIWSHMTRKILCKEAKAPTVSLWERKKTHTNFHIHLRKKPSTVTLLSTRWGADRHICVNLFKWQSSNVEWCWLGTALGCSFGEGRGMIMQDPGASRSSEETAGFVVAATQGSLWDRAISIPAGVPPSW